MFVLSNNTFFYDFSIDIKVYLIFTDTRIFVARLESYKNVVNTIRHQLTIAFQF